ncbi:hypothetical protein VE02_05425 [Pseudogymnoascus sp. 03VT05]|nr:hypothetical protein VE02_05425 [Pseudogymnoascus sp. 03VT05]
MLDGLFILLVLSVVMAVASFLAGALPLSMSLSQSQLRLLSAIGMGVLVGTSLVVIIPEGIEAVYASSIQVHTNGARAPPLLLTPRTFDSPTFYEAASALPGPVIPEDTSIFERRADSDTVADAVHPAPGPIVPGSSNLEDFPTIHSDDAAVSASSSASTTTHPHTAERSPPTFYIGFSLITGFILMFLIDKLPRHATSTLASPPTRHISLNNLSDDSPPSPTSGDSFLHSLAPSPKQTRSLATTTGLVIHAAADGIAMGASATSSNTKLGFIIFLAIMLHKAPAAFGLTSVLLKQGLSKRAARGHLIIFSLASPIGALTTWLLVNIAGGGAGMEGENGQWWTGMLLLFSAGTFLYVAMHAMQDDAAGHEHGSGSTLNGFGDGGGGGGGAGGKRGGKPVLRDTVASVVGMLIPLVTQVGHHH